MRGDTATGPSSQGIGLGAVDSCLLCLLALHFMSFKWSRFLVEGNFFFLPGSLLHVGLVIATHWCGILSVCISKSAVWNLVNRGKSHCMALCEVVLAQHLVVHFISTEICPELCLKDQVGFISCEICEANTSSNSSGNPEMLDILVKVPRFKFCGSRISHLV